jgi:hypothetical protein
MDVTPGYRDAVERAGLEPVGARPDIMRICPYPTPAPCSWRGTGTPPSTRSILLDVKMAAEPSLRHFASYAGVAPVEVSSGEVTRHQLSLAGNRRLDHALHMIAINQVRYQGEGGTSYHKKITEGKTHREAMRCLKRRVSDAVFKRLRAGVLRRAPKLLPTRFVAGDTGARDGRFRSVFNNPVRL